MDTDSFLFHLKKKIFIKISDYAEDAEARFQTSNFEIIILVKDKLPRQIMKELAGLRAKTYRYLKDTSDEDEKARGKNIVS